MTWNKRITKFKLDEDGIPCLRSGEKIKVTKTETYDPETDHDGSQYERVRTLLYGPQDHPREEQHSIVSGTRQQPPHRAAPKDPESRPLSSGNKNDGAASTSSQSTSREMHPPLPPPIAGPFFKSSTPTHEQLLNAAYLFDLVARSKNITYAMIGGLAAHIFGGTRATTSLDILLSPRRIGNHLFQEPVLQDLFHSREGDNAGILAISEPDEHGQRDRIVVTTEHAGVAVNVLDCVNNPYDFPDLIPPNQPDGSAWTEWDPEPTFDYVSPVGFPDTVKFPVLLPRLLLRQRVLHFGRSDATLVTDLADIKCFLDVLQGMEDQCCTPQEEQELLPKVKNLMRFGHHNFLTDENDVRRWGNINIFLPENWRE